MIGRVRGAAALLVGLCAVAVASLGAAQESLAPCADDWNEYAPEWSPDGERLLFTSTRSGAETHLYEVEVATGEVLRGASVKRL